jgi:DNA-binding response OmpR family regulator
MSNHVLIVEDNTDMRNSLADYLKSEDLSVIAVSSAEEAIDVVDENDIDAGIVDINLPGKSGFDLIEYVREQGHSYPLLAMTARESIDDKLRGFNLGLTDYIVKPFDVKELTARLKVHLRNAGGDSEEQIKIGEYSANPKNLSFTKAGKNIELTQLEFRLAYALLRHNDTIVKLDDLIEFAWGESDQMINPPIRIHIANLRKKIGDTNYEIIRTIPGKGYIFNAQMEQK